MITLLNKFDDNYIMEKKDILEIVDYYINEDKLDSYLKDVFFDDKSKHAGAYNIRTKIIVLNDEEIIKFCYRMFDKLSRVYQIDEDYYTYFVNFYYLSVLFHEIQHAIQEKKYSLMNNKENLYTFLYEMCRKVHGSDQAFYNENHDLFPMEIDANNNSYLKAYNLISYTKLPAREKRILYTQYLFSLLYNYKRVNNYRILTPVDKLAKKNQDFDIDLIFKLLDETKLSKIERLNFGLCITPSEFDAIDREKRFILYRNINKRK